MANKKRDIQNKIAKLQKQAAIYSNIKPGRPCKFPTPEALWERAKDYFEWCEENPILEQKLFPMQGEVMKEHAKKCRAFTMTGLCIFIGLDTETFRRYGTGEIGGGKFKDVYKLIQDVVREQQFTGAAADVLNPNIIARALGLYEKTVNENLHVNVQMTKEEVKEISNQLESEV